MPKVHVSWDRNYPVFFLTIPDSPDYVIHLTKKEIKRFVRACDEWERVQEMVRDRSGWK